MSSHPAPAPATATPTPRATTTLTAPTPQTQTPQEAKVVRYLDQLYNQNKKQFAKLIHQARYFAYPLGSKLQPQAQAVGDQAFREQRKRNLKLALVEFDFGLDNLLWFSQRVLSFTATDSESLERPKKKRKQSTGTVLQELEEELTGVDAAREKHRKIMEILFPLEDSNFQASTVPQEGAVPQELQVPSLPILSPLDPPQELQVPSLPILSPLDPPQELQVPSLPIQSPLDPSLQLSYP